jgi:hypothetical protein
MIASSGETPVYEEIVQKKSMHVKMMAPTAPQAGLLVL